MTTILTSVNWSEVPVFTIDIGKMTDPNEITSFFKQHGIDYYIYQINYNHILFKYGMSADNAGVWGERLYRQIAHSCIWEEGVRHEGSSGAEYRIIEEKFKTQYDADIDKSRMTVRVWDFTNYEFDSIDAWKEIENIEQQMIATYEQLTGAKPIGNLNQVKDYRKRARIPKSVASSLFEGGLEIDRRVKKFHKKPTDIKKPKPKPEE